MPSQAMKDIKFGFMVGIGLFVFGIVATILLALASKALVE